MWKNNTVVRKLQALQWSDNGACCNSKYEEINEKTLIVYFIACKPKNVTISEVMEPQCVIKKCNESGVNKQIELVSHSINKLRLYYRCFCSLYLFFKRSISKENLFKTHLLSFLFDETAYFNKLDHWKLFQRKN